MANPAVSVPGRIRAPRPAPPRRAGALLAVILALAAAVRVLRWQVTAVLFNDGPVFLAIADFVREGRFADALGHPFHPLYPLLVAAVQGFVPDAEVAAILVSVAGGTLAVAGLYLLVRAAFGTREALVAAFLLAVHPQAIIYSGDVQSEGLYLGLFVTAAALLWRGLSGRSAGAAALFGLLGGLAYLTRPEGLGLVLVGGAWALAAGWRGGWTRGESLRFVLALALGAVLTAGPYLGWLSAEAGGFSVSGKKSLGVVTGVVDEPFQGPDPLAANPQLPWVRDADDPAPGSPEARPPRPEPGLPAQLADAVFDLIQTHLRSLRYELAAIALAGLLLVRPRPGLRFAILASVVAAYAAVLLLLRWNVGYVSGRHTLPTMTLLFGYVAWSAIVLADAAGRRREWLRRATLLALLAVVAAIGLGKALRPDRLDAVAERRAAEWLRAQDETVHALAARKRRTAYYAHAPWVKLATAAFPGGLRKLGATHLIVSDDDLEDYGKLGPLQPPEAREIHSVDAEGEIARVYELYVGAVERGQALGRVEAYSPRP